MAEKPDPMSIANCVGLGVIKFIAISGMQHILENAEKKNTMNIPVTPPPVIFLTRA